MSRKETCIEWIKSGGQHVESWLDYNDMDQDEALEYARDYPDLCFEDIGIVE